MIIFSTKFYVKKSLTKDKLIELALQWINESPHYELQISSWNGEEVFEVENEKQKFSIIKADEERIIAIHLENIDETNVLWTNDFVLEEGDVTNILVVRLTHDAMDKETKVLRVYNRPRLMKTIINLGYGDVDNGLQISDKPMVINKGNIKLMEDIIEGKADFLLPIVYVTKKFLNNGLMLDVAELAKDLAGTAHVLVEENTCISAELKRLTGGKNPFNGAVHIYYTDKVGTRIIPEEFVDINNFRYSIVDSVCTRLSLLKLEDKYTWGTVKYRKLLLQYHNGQKESSELEKTCEEIIKLKEKENSQLIEDLQSELFVLRSKVENYEYALQNKKESNGDDIVIKCEEKDFFKGEIKDFLIEILQEKQGEMEGDANQMGWRRYHVLKSILKCNKIEGNAVKLANDLKDILSRIDRIDAKDRRRLRELGFEMKENSHNKLYFHGDSRYYITLGKTPSDNHAASNAAAIAINTIICSGKQKI